MPNMMMGSPTNGQSLRKSIQLAPATLTTDESHRNWDQQTSNKSLSVRPHIGIKSGIFRLEPTQDYNELRLDFMSSSRAIFADLSQNYLSAI